LTERTFLSTLERYGIKRIVSLGQRFDPHQHQAMMEIEDPTKPAGTVVLEMQAGYVIHDRLLREAMVGVSRAGPSPSRATPESTRQLNRPSPRSPSPSRFAGPSLSRKGRGFGFWAISG